jgi:S-DNA-T family DNA segregation ATPase FtsK/SpoIIIE
MPHLSLGLSPAVGRSLVGLTLLVLGAILLIAIALQGQGKLTDAVRDIIAPYFGAGRFLLPFLLLAAGWYVEWGPGQAPGAPWGRTLLGLAIAFAGLLGLVQILAFRGEFTGGHVGRFLAGLLTPLLTAPGAFVILLGMSLGGLLVAFDVPLRALMSPATRAARAAGGTLQSRTAPDDPRARPVDPVRGGAPSNGYAGAQTDTGPGAGIRRGRSPHLAPGEAPGQTGAFGTEPADDRLAPFGMPAPTSATIAPQRMPGASAEPAPAGMRQPAAARPVDRDGDGVTEAEDSPRTRGGVDWVLPAPELLDASVPPTAAAGANQDAVHARNEARIIEKLNSFGINARILGRNAGPVVTQYEVAPDAHVKLSRIEALSDDLAMALAARSIRIEAPIPGRAAVGIEVPNQEFNIVALRRIFDEVDFAATGSKLTFALGRDVAGKGMAVDLARMPHLLIAGATGSGKSVMVNALITSLLCKARPDEIRMILMDLKRVELAGYNGLPHLLVPVITEPERAKSALKWAVAEMEHRYRRFAAQAARNIKVFNDSRADPADKLPYIVIIVDELADLMMREGKNVEDPIVRLAQKARATGIHMVLATQRPSVNVVTGLIKANFPSRIAFAMASQIDSRTILDTPGAEDLIGRGDMLYQPSDLPKPMRLQGVFVSDAEIGRVTDAWRAQIDDPGYDMRVVAGDEDTPEIVEQSPHDEVDALLQEALGVIREYDRASASLLQRRLRIGYARAARIMDQLQDRGYVGPPDRANARAVLVRDDGPAQGDGDEV